MTSIGATGTDWNEAERLWRSGAALGGGKRDKDTDLNAADGRGAGRKK